MPHAPFMKTECDYLYGWIKKVTYTKISPKMVNPRIKRGTQKKKKKKKKNLKTSVQTVWKAWTNASAHNEEKE